MRLHFGLFNVQFHKFLSFEESNLAVFSKNIHFLDDFNPNKNETSYLSLRVNSQLFNLIERQISKAES